MEHRPKLGIISVLLNGWNGFDEHSYDGKGKKVQLFTCVFFVAFNKKTLLILVLYIYFRRKDTDCSVGDHPNVIGFAIFQRF